VLADSRAHIASHSGAYNRGAGKFCCRASQPCANLKWRDPDGGDFVRAEMVKAFLSSDEYRNRFRQQ
jgi:hypothetical protein